MTVTKLVTVVIDGIASLVVVIVPDDAVPTVTVTVEVTGVHVEFVSASEDIKVFCCTPEYKDGPGIV